jgi:exopolysaccharide biosynthesis protein
VLVALCVGLVYLVFRPGGDGSLRLKAPTRTKIGPGLELLDARLERAGRDVGAFVVLYAELDATRLALVMNDDKKKIAALEDGAALVTNAGYFTKEWRTTGLLASQGEVLSPFVKNAGGAGSGVLLVEDATVALLERDRVGDRKFDRAEIAIQAGPRIIEPGHVPGIKGDDGLRANRTFAGGTRDGRFFVGVCYDDRAGGTVGPTLFELQSLLLDERVDVAFALNLDGGPSTGFDLRVDGHQRHFEEKGAVRSVLSVTARP